MNPQSSRIHARPSVPQFAFRAFHFAFYFVTAALLAAQPTSILNTPHNLSVSGPGPVRATSEERVCIFCHTPHGARTSAPLWNRRDSTASYLPYNSPTLKASVGQPTGASKLCLSCHDGTIALGDLVSEDQPVAMGQMTMPAGSSRIGTDLRDDHPISFSYLDALSQKGTELAPPGGWFPQLRLDADSQVQCTTCHDPHNNQWNDFLVMSNQGAALCTQCHRMTGYDQTPHALSAATWSGGGRDPWPHSDFNDVASNSCMNCHASHSAGGPQFLLNYGPEHQTCFSCHDGSVAQSNIEGVFNKTSRHTLSLATEDRIPGAVPIGSVTSVECSDCHNPHRARTAPAVAPFVKGSMEGVTGVDANGATINEAIYEYQVCFKCHGPNAIPSFDVIPRQIPTADTIKQFHPSSPSYHPVEAAGRGMDQPSLIAPLGNASLIYCSDCHNNDGAGAGAAGPHGSTHKFLLVREYRTGDNVAESPSAYALCYGCHSRTSILNDESFPTHRRHIVDGRISCSTCHDAHGIDYGRGNTVNNARLINFDISIVEPDPVTGLREFRSLGPNSGQCALTCHGVDHSPKTY